jgi:hypothetical protein
MVLGTPSSADVVSESFYFQVLVVTMELSHCCMAGEAFIPII